MRRESPVMYLLSPSRRTTTPLRINLNHYRLCRNKLNPHIPILAFRHLLRPQILHLTALPLLQPDLFHRYHYLTLIGKTVIERSHHNSILILPGENIRSELSLRTRNRPEALFSSGSFSRSNSSSEPSSP